MDRLVSTTIAGICESIFGIHLSVSVIATQLSVHSAAFGTVNSHQLLGTRLGNPDGCRACEVTFKR